MKKAWTDLKTFVTVCMTFTMIVLLFIPYQLNKEVLMLFSTSYGAIMTYFFSSRED